MARTPKQPVTVAELKLVLQDLPDSAHVILEDPDTNWFLVPYFSVPEDKSRIVITASYGDDYEPNT